METLVEKCNEQQQQQQQQQQEKRTKTVVSAVSNGRRPERKSADSRVMSSAGNPQPAPVTKEKKVLPTQKKNNKKNDPKKLRGQKKTETKEHSRS